jgi:hypothetical protein
MMARTCLDKLNRVRLEDLMRSNLIVLAVVTICRIAAILSQSFAQLEKCALPLAAPGLRLSLL